MRWSPYEQSPARVVARSNPNDHTLGSRCSAIRASAQCRTRSRSAMPETLPAAAVVRLGIAGPHLENASAGGWGGKGGLVGDDLRAGDPVAQLAMVHGGRGL